MLLSFDFIAIVGMGLISTLVIYSLLVADVDEQTYMFAMMRAIGFTKDNLLVFVTFQALTFAIPGMFLGLIASSIANTGFRLFVYYLYSINFEYGLSS